MERQVHFCTTDDGVRIAYCVEGSGPDLLCCPDFVGSFSLDRLIDDQMGFWRKLWHGRRVIRYDMRGTGLSQRDPPEVTHDGVCRDLEAVVRAAGARDFTLYASTLSGPRAIAYAARHPDDVRRLILHRTFARATDTMTVEQAKGLADLSRLNWPMAAQAMADLPVRHELPDLGVNQAHLYVRSTSGEIVARILTEGFRTTDVTELLPSVRVPTLILHRADDPMFPFAMAERLSAGIAGSQLVPLGEGIMAYLAQGRIGEILNVINDFVDDGAATSADDESRARSRSFQAVLWTDLVSHTEMMQRLGDAKGRDVLRDHERITRATLRAHGGSEVKTMGDGFIASFGSITQAVECAIALQRAFAARNHTAEEPLSVRVGLNAGEPIEEEGDLFGSTVILASRIAMRAGAGEILIPEPVRHLLSGKPFVYADRGEFVPKGFDDAVRLYEVRWRDEP